AVVRQILRYLRVAKGGRGIVSFFNLIFLSEKDVMMNHNAEKTVIKGLFRLIKIASIYTMSVF
ncbi:hypothetical protein AB9H31_23210, partial [Salmonella enterica subsp. enterica serovar Kentucky]